MSDRADLIVGPDDHLVIALPVDTDLAHMDEIAAEMRRRFPLLADRIVFVAGVEQMAVVQPATT